MRSIQRAHVLMKLLRRGATRFIKECYLLTLRRQLLTSSSQRAHFIVHLLEASRRSFSLVSPSSDLVTRL